MKKQIIVHLDPLNIQHDAVTYGVMLARKLDLPLLLYSVQSMMTVPVAVETGGQVLTTNPAMQPHDWSAKVAEKAKDYCEEIKRQYPRTTCEHELGTTGGALVDKVKGLHRSLSQRDPYLLVMPKVSEHDWWNDLVGTVETTVAAEASCPVLFVPEGAELGGIGRVMYLADEKSLQDYDYPGFNFLRDFSKKMDTKITVGFLGGELTNQRGYDVGAAMERLRQSLPFQGNHAFRFFAGMEADELLTLAKITSTDIVAFPFRESNVMSRFFDDEITRTLLLKADSPVLVF